MQIQCDNKHSFIKILSSYQPPNQTQHHLEITLMHMDLPLLYFTIGQRYYTVWIYHVFFNRYPIVVCYVAARHNLVQMPFCICKDTSSRQIYRAGPAGSQVNGVSLVDCQQPPMRVYHSELPSAKGSYLFPQSSPIVCAIQLFEFLLL